MKKYFLSRIKFHESKPKVEAQGFKNMRQVAQSYDPCAIASMDPQEKWRIKHKETIEINNNNIHIRKKEARVDMQIRNRDCILEPIRALKLPTDVTRVINGFLQRNVENSEVLAPKHTYKYLDYMDQFQPLGEDDAICTLDRNTRGFARMSTVMYHIHMENVYLNDSDQYQLIYDNETLLKEFKKLRDADKYLRPSCIQPRNIYRVGFEYINLKEKCASKFQELAGVPNAFLSHLSCQKQHSHMREVSTQQEADVTNLRAISRDIDFLFSKDPAESLQSGGLHLMRDEILNDINTLIDDPKHWFKCRRCNQPKLPITIGKADIAQMFKCILKSSVMSGYVKLAKRVETTTRCKAIIEKRDRAGRRYTVFAKHKFTLKGTKCFSYIGKRNDIHMSLRWGGSVRSTSNVAVVWRWGTLYRARKGPSY